MSTKDVTDLMVCRAVVVFRGNGMQGPDPYEILATQTNESIKVCYRAMERAHKRGLIEYGVSLRTAWLTDAGTNLVNTHSDRE
jgi:hypothetical protein